MPGVCLPQSRTPGRCEAGSQRGEAGSPTPYGKVGQADAPSRLTRPRRRPRGGKGPGRSAGPRNGPVFSQRSFWTSWERTGWEVRAFPPRGGAGREGRKETGERQTGVRGEGLDRGPLPRGLLSQGSGPPQPPTARCPPAGTARGAQGQPLALLCTVSSCGFQKDSPLSAQFGPLGCPSPRRTALPRPRGRQGLNWCQPLGASPVIRGLGSTEGPPSLGEPQVSESISVGLRSLVFSSLGAEGGNVSHRCLLQLPKGPEPTQVPRALLLGTVRVLRDPGSVLGQKESPRLGPPQGRSFPVLHSGPAHSTELGFLAEAGSCRPQPPGSPGSSSWNIPGCPASPGTTGDRSFPPSPQHPPCQEPKSKQCSGKALR